MIPGKYVKKSGNEPEKFLGREPYSEWVEPMASFMFNQNTAELLFYAQNERV